MRPGNNGKQANTTHNNIFPNTNKRYGFLTLTERGVMGKVDFFKGYTSVEDVCHHLCEHFLPDLEVGPVQFRTFSCTEQKSTKTSDKGKKIKIKKYRAEVQDGADITTKFPAVECSDPQYSS